jgi:integrase
MSLTELGIKQAKPQEKEYMLHDDRGLYLLVKPAGGKYWRLRYWQNSKETKMSLGVYPTVTLKEAREKRNELRKGISNGIDPKEAQRTTQNQPQELFEEITNEWFFKKVKSVRAESHYSKVWSRVERFVLPVFGKRSIRDITASEILMLLRRLEDRGIIDTAHRVMNYCSQIFRYAVATGRAERDPTADLRGALQPLKSKHRAAITDPVKIQQLLRAMDAFDGTYIVKCGLWFSAYTFVRPGEVRHAEWKEFDLEGAEWKIPSEKIKMKRPHIVPLAKQVIELLKSLKLMTGHGPYVFPSLRSSKGTQPMSENTILYALRRMGFSEDEMCAHGFRGMASTRLNEQGWHPDCIERQLAHVEGNSVRAAYNYAEYLPERRKMMQTWADYLDSLKAQ